MENKQTAVIWLQQAMKSTLSYEQIMAVEGLYQQALAMEKEQIIEAWDKACTDQDRIGREYYEQTYVNNA